MTKEIDRADLWKMIKSIRIAMLATASDSGLRSRPMSAIVNTDAETIDFLTQSDNDLCMDLKQDPSINLSFADQSNENYISISGMAQQIHDPIRARELWNIFAQAWFPDGPEDPNLTILSINASRADIWDGKSSRFLQSWELAKALVTGSEPNMGEKETIKL